MHSAHMGVISNWVCFPGNTLLTVAQCMQGISFVMWLTDPPHSGHICIQLALPQKGQKQVYDLQCNALTSLVHFAVQIQTQFLPE